MDLSSAQSPSPAEIDAMTSEETTVVIVGAGPAGLGMAALLSKCGIAAIVIEKGRVGESFLKWPKETRFISPSFTGNFFGSVDLNAVTPNSSPAFGTQSEHPTGAEYCKYLNDVVGFCKLDVRTGVTVTGFDGLESYTYGEPAPQTPPIHNHDNCSHNDHGQDQQHHTAHADGSGHQEHTARDIMVDQAENSKSHNDRKRSHANKASQEAREEAAAAAEAAFSSDKIMEELASWQHDQPPILVHTTECDYSCKFLVWAGGEFNFPTDIPCTIRPGESYKEIPVGKHVIIGGSESGMDAAYHLIKNGSEVIVLDSTATWEKRVSDSSYGLSPYTCGRVREMQASGRLQLVAERAISITDIEVRTKNHTFCLEHPAINATGFDFSKSLAGQVFDFKEGHCGITARLTVEDESTKFRNVFLTGPTVVHDKAVFCFIYKYRQRWAIIAREILMRLGRYSEAIEEYSSKGFMLEDLSCCGNDCVC